MRTLPALLLLTLACSAAPVRAESSSAGGPEVRALIDRVTAAYGGRPALEKVKAYRVEGSLFSAMRHSDSPTVRVFARPGRLKVMLDYANGAEMRFVDGDRGWRSEGGGPVEEAQGPMFSAMVLQAARAGVPWILYEHADEASFTDSLEQNGVRCAGVLIPLGKGLLLRAWVHPGNFHVVRSQGLLSQGGMSTHFETVYSDFRVVDGVTFAFREENFASGHQTGLTTITKVVLNPPIRPGEFQPSPAGAPRSRRGDS